MTFMAEVRKQLTKDAERNRRTRLAVRIISGLVSKQDKAHLRMEDAHTWRWESFIDIYLRRAGSSFDASEAFERLRRRLVQEGCETELGREYRKYSETLQLELIVKGLAGLQIRIHLDSLDLGPDCVIETREVDKVVEYQPEVAEHTETETQHVAICTDPVSGEKKEVVI